MQTHIHKIKHGLKLEAESADVQQQWGGGGGGRHQSQQETICNRMSVLVNLGEHMDMHVHMQAHRQTVVCAGGVAAPASGSLLMHVDGKLEPLGMKPSGSVCPVHQRAFTEVPETTRVPASTDWHPKRMHQFNSLLPTHQTADGLINSQRTWLQI